MLGNTISPLQIETDQVPRNKYFEKLCNFIFTRYLSMFYYVPKYLGVKLL